jgi:hypothetical protein
MSGKFHLLLLVRLVKGGSPMVTAGILSAESALDGVLV